jgi:predicted exporter
MSDWINPVQASKTFSTYLKQLPTKGKLAWEYNPFRNYRIDRTMWDYRNGLYTQEELRD